MKKLLIFTCVLTLCFSVFGKVIMAKQITGHSQFQRIVFVDQNYKLLSDLGEEAFSEKYKANMKTRWIGWNTYYYLINAEMDFVGETIFSRSNRTSNTITFAYSLEETKTTSRSISVSSSICSKVASGDKELNGSLQADVDTQIKGEKTVSQVESIAFEVVIPINKKVTLRSTGSGVVSSGYSAYYFFWICFKKGAWEIVDVIDTFYELYEEDV